MKRRHHFILPLGELRTAAEEGQILRTLGESRPCVTSDPVTRSLTPHTRAAPTRATHTHTRAHTHTRTHIRLDERTIYNCTAQQPRYSKMVALRWRAIKWMSDAMWAQRSNRLIAAACMHSHHIQHTERSVTPQHNMTRMGHCSR